MYISKNQIEYINKKIEVLKNDPNNLSDVFLISRLIDEIIKQQNQKRILH